jgi:choline-sulfatase
LKELYTKEVESVDQRLGYILDVLKYRDLLDDTYIIFTSDHGELFGEHGWWCHGHFFYEELVNVPLIIAGPDIPKGKRVNNIVSHVDIIETVLDLLNCKFQYKSQGKSFKNLLSSNPFKQLLFKANNNFVYFSYANFWGRHQDALRQNDYKLMCGLDGTYELYNLADDPMEMNNLSNKHPEVVKIMAGRLIEIREENTAMQKSRTKVEKNVPINKDLTDQLKALGYIQ